MVRKTPEGYSPRPLTSRDSRLWRVNANHSLWIKEQGLAAIGIGWRAMLMSFRARIRQVSRLVSGCSVQCQGPSDAYRGRLQGTPDGSLWYARYPFGRVRASFEFEQLT